MKPRNMLVVCCALISACAKQSPREINSSTDVSPNGQQSHQDPKASLLLAPVAAEMNHRAPDQCRVHLETSKGVISLEIHREWSPAGADRFYNLVLGGYYDQARFFRVIKGRWAQFGIHGDPKIASLWRKQTIPDDARRESNSRGTIAYAFAVPNGRTT
jgi:peptidyl-prolyl cis-trans isomerase A (cyclophilin A)